jgi:hypothetical protein
VEPAYFVVVRRRKSVSARSSSARRGRDPYLIAPLACARCVEWLAPLAAMFARSRLFVGSDETIVSEDQLLLDAFVGSSCRSAALRSLRANRAVEPAYFVVARRQEARLLTPPQHGGGAIRQV